MENHTPTMFAEGDFIQLSYKTIAFINESTLGYVYEAMYDPSEKSKKINKLKNSIHGGKTIRMNITLPKAEVFRPDSATNKQNLSFKTHVFKILKIFMRPRSKSDGTPRNVIFYKSISVERAMSKKGYHFLLEETSSLQMVIIKSMLFEHAEFF